MFVALVDELMGQPIAVLDAALADAKRKRDEADLEIAAITAVVDSQCSFQIHGHRSVNGYLKQQLNCTGPDARRIKRRGRLFNEHPEIGERLGASRIGAAQADLLADAQQHPVAGERFGEFASMLTDHAERLDYADFAAAVKHFIVCADPDGSFDDQRFREEHRTASVAEIDGAVSVHAAGGDPLQAVEMKSIFDRAVQTEFQNDCETRRVLYGDDALAHPLPRSGDQRRFDALYAIFIASTTAPVDGKRPEPLVNILIDVDTGIDALARHGLLDVELDESTTEFRPVDPSTRRCATSTGTAIHPDVAVRAMIRGSIRRVIVDAHGVVIDLGRTQRLFTGKTRDAARLLAVRCGHRGCDVPAELCDIDHVDEWANGGATNQANALPLCGVHDRWKHRQQLRGRRDRIGRIHLVRPDGTVIKPLNARDPDWPDNDNTRPRSVVRHVLTWDEWTASRTPTRRCTPKPDCTVTIYDLRTT